jgi:hypothetical protein
MLTHAQATLPTVATDSPDDRRPIVVVRPVPTLFVGAASGRIQRIGVFLPFFPPRSETSPPSLCRDPARPARSTSHSHWLGGACANERRTGARARVLQLRRLPVRLCRLHALTTQHSGAPSYSRQRGFPYRGYRFADTWDSDNRQSRVCSGETHVLDPALLRSVDSAGRGGESISPPTPCFLVYQVSRLWEKSLSTLTTGCTD